MQEKLTAQEGYFYSLYTSLLPDTKGDPHQPHEGAVQIQAQGAMTAFNVMPDSAIYKDVKKRLSGICKDLDEVMIKNGDKFLEPQAAKELYSKLQKENHPICTKINDLVTTLEINKETTNQLFDFLKSAEKYSAEKNANKEFDSKSFAGFFEQNKNTFPALSADDSTSLAKITNEYLKMKDKPKDFNAFADKLGEQKQNRSLSQKLLDCIVKIFSVKKAKLILERASANIHLHALNTNLVKKEKQTMVEKVKQQSSAEGRQL